MAKAQPENLVEAVMQSVSDDQTPPVLRANIERQSQRLLGLATSLFQSGIDEEKVRSIIEKAYASYRDELIGAILELRKPHGK